jgi:ankyrin repeat protein
VKKFLDYGADPNRICGSTYSTPLHDAVLGGHCEIIKLLLSHGALQVLVDENSWTPLHLACWKNDVLSIRCLIADRKHACEAVRIKDRHGQTPNHLCQRRIVKDVIESMLPSSLLSCSLFLVEFMTDHKIPIKKATWWNTLSNSLRVRVDGKERDHKDAIKQYVIKARMKGQAPKDSDYY